MVVDRHWLLALSHGIGPDRVLIVGPRTRALTMRRHHVLLIGPVIDVDGSRLHPTLLESLGLFLQSLCVLLIGLNKLNFLLGSFIILLILLIL